MDIQGKSGVAHIGTVKKGQSVVITLSPARVIQTIRFTSDVRSDNVSMKFRYLDLSKPQGIPKPRGYVYSYGSLSLKGLENHEIENSNITFQVDRSWIQRIGRYPSNVSIERFSDGYYRYISSTPGFSYFAVTYLKRRRPQELLNVKNIEIDTGDGVSPVNLSLRITVENYGLVKGTKEIDVFLDGDHLTSKKLSLEPGETKILPFFVTVKDTGEHTIRVDDISRRFVVHKPRGRIPSILILVFLVIILSLAVFLIYHYRIYEG
ncbi:MAG: PGF-pre-PGF domain-containing protein, partial [Candidatus Aenigmatarchaeota archaeon]